MNPLILRFFLGSAKLCCKAGPAECMYPLFDFLGPTTTATQSNSTFSSDMSGWASTQIWCFLKRFIQSVYCKPWKEVVSWTLFNISQWELLWMVLHKSVEYSWQQCGHTILTGCALFWDITQCTVVIQTGVVGLTGYSETPTENRHTTLSNITEQCRSCLHCGRSLKWCTILIYFLTCKCCPTLTSTIHW